MLLTRLLILVLLCGSFGCSTVTITSRGSAKRIDEPTYESMRSYYLWGLVGTHTIDVSQVCRKSRVIQMQAQDTFLDGFLQFITIGIYAPRTAKVWCEKGDAT